MKELPGRKLVGAEDKAEKVLSKERVMDTLLKYAGESSVPVEERSDGSGLYMLEVEIEGDTRGETTRYSYLRKGRYPGGDSLKASISVVYYVDGIPVGGHTVAYFNTETNMWDEP